MGFFLYKCVAIVTSMQINQCLLHRLNCRPYAFTPSSKEAYFLLPICVCVYRLTNNHPYTLSLPYTHNITHCHLFRKLCDVRNKYNFIFLGYNML